MNIYSPKKIHAFGAFYNEQLISVRFCLNHKETLYDWYAASLPNHNKFYPNDYIVFKVFLLIFSMQE